MKRIYKYRLFQTLLLPAGAVIREVAHQRGEVMVWAEVDPDAFPEPFQVHIVATGALVPERAVYLKTLFEGAFVWHVYLEKQS